MPDFLARVFSQPPFALSGPSPDSTLEGMIANYQAKQMVQRKDTQLLPARNGCQGALTVMLKYLNQGGGCDKDEGQSKDEPDIDRSH